MIGYGLLRVGRNPTLIIDGEIWNSEWEDHVFLKISPLKGTVVGMYTLELHVLRTYSFMK